MISHTIFEEQALRIRRSETRAIASIVYGLYDVEYASESGRPPEAHRAA